MIEESMARKYCAEELSLIENYAAATADKRSVWHCHHRAEILPCGRFSRRQLMASGLYYGVPAAQLIFMPASEHARLHRLGMTHSEQTRQRMSLAASGASNSFFGHHHTRRARRRMSLAKLGAKNPMHGKKVSAVAKKKISERLSGMRWWNNGVKLVRARDCPPGFAPGRCLRRS